VLPISLPKNGYGKVYEVIDERIQEWIVAQKVFFVATAPLSGEGHINCSPIIQFEFSTEGLLSTST
jgi:predicted pyridoxine 5'-phosphate oxidase superfamily flavin-nucleotide-binding protein